MILVTGGGGFIGRHVCMTLAAQGQLVIAADLELPQCSQGKSPYLAFAGDVTNPVQLERIFQQYPITAIIHLASLLNTASRQNPDKATQVNIMGSLNIFEAARKFQTPKVIYGSSISVYGSVSAQHGDLPVTEDFPPSPDDVYGAAKRYVEILGAQYAQQFGFQFSALRIASVIGPGTASASSPWRTEIFEKLGQAQRTEIQIPYTATAKLPFVYVADVAAMAACLVNAQQFSGRWYNTPAETWTFQELAAVVEALNPQIQLVFGNAKIHGIPTIIKGDRFRTEFGYQPVMSIQERFRRTVQKHLIQ